MWYNGGANGWKLFENVFYLVHLKFFHLLIQACIEQVYEVK